MENRTKLTPPQLAKLWGISPNTIVSWIRSGQLRAIDISTRPGIGRPRYLIDRRDIVEFEERRQVKPPEPVRRRREKLPADFIHYF